jgi:hypothetical protein
LFRDESDLVVRKAQIRYQELAKAKAEKKQRQQGALPAASDPSYGQPPLRNQQIVTRTTIIAPAPAIKPLLDDQGISFFLSNHVLPSSVIPRCQFDFLPEMLMDPDSENILRVSVAAAGLAGLAVATKSPHIMKKAHVQYGNALRLANRAIQTNATATKDSTLVAVILLGIYESFQSEKHDSVNSWAKHMEGACTLVSLRGNEQLLRGMGNRIFRQFYALLLAASFELKQPTPQAMTDLWSAYMEVGNSSIFGEWSLYEMVRRMRRASDFVSSQWSIDDPLRSVTTALQLDKDLDLLQRDVPRIFEYRTVYLQQPDKHAFGDSYHIYLDPWIARMWNNWRTGRIMLNRIICAEVVKCSERSPAIFTPEVVATYIRASAQVIRVNSDDICASAPQIIGQLPFPDIPITQKRKATSNSLFGLPDLNDLSFGLSAPGTFLKPGTPSGMQQLIWPLYQAVLGGEASCDRKLWAINILHFLALRSGARQAVVLADDLKQLIKHANVTRSDLR